jgi:hypothetical protein
VIATESRLWQVLRDAAAEVPGTSYTRVETGLTHEGVADVEYVHRPWHGWVELKIGRTWPKPGKPFTLRHPFSMAQLTWLIWHHAPHYYLRSWLLVGFAGHQRWSSFLLLPPPQSVSLVEGRIPVPHEYVLARSGVAHRDRIEEVVKIIGAAKELETGLKLKYN